MAHRSRAAWLLIVLGALAATPDVAQQSRQFAITEVNIVDVTNGRITPARTVVINGDVVSEISGSAPPRPERKLSVVLGGRLFDRTAHDTLLAQTRAAAAQ